MGTKSSQIYSTPLHPPESPDETEIFGNPIKKSALNQTSIDNIETLQELFINSCKKHPQRPFVGSRSPDGFFLFHTYQECFDLVNSLGEAILKLNLCTKTVDEFHDLEIDVIGIFSKNREEWVITDLACMMG